MKNFKSIVLPTILGIIAAAVSLALNLNLLTCFIVTLGIWLGSLLIFSPSKQELAEIPLSELPFKDKIKILDKNISSLRSITDKLEKESVRKDLNKITDTLDKIRNTVRDDQEKYEKNSKVFEYYIPTLIRVLENYNNVEDNNISTEDSQKLMRNTENIVTTFKDVFRKVLDGLYENDIFDTNAEVTTLENLLKMGGYK